uniref:Uncharacterized protein n=1 Tax=Rhizophora mucronata TaxID=61149 RepID=A0A2P2NJU4_RHIMU
MCGLSLFEITCPTSSLDSANLGVLSRSLCLYISL